MHVLSDSKAMCQTSIYQANDFKGDSFLALNKAAKPK
jgi:hypothetical protein